MIFSSRKKNPEAGGGKHDPLRSEPGSDRRMRQGRRARLPQVQMVRGARASLARVSGVRSLCQTSQPRRASGDEDSGERLACVQFAGRWLRGRDVLQGAAGGNMKISQREARKLRKRIEELEKQEDKRGNAWSS